MAELEGNRKRKTLNNGEKAVVVELERNHLEKAIVRGEGRAGGRLVKDDVDKHQTLYMCFVESKRFDSKHWVMQAIDLGDLLGLSSRLSPSSCPRGSETEKSLREVACFSGGELELPDGVGCGVFGSKILFAGGYNHGSAGREVYTFETDPSVDPNPKIERGLFPSFISGKREPLFMQPGDGKLYAVTSVPLSSHTFEAFDPRESIWSPLPNPPHFNGAKFTSYGISGTSIMLWSGRTRYDFDVAEPHKGWKAHRKRLVILSSPGGSPLVINHDVDGDSHGGTVIVFTYGKGDYFDVCLMPSGREDHTLTDKDVEFVQLPNQDQFPPDFLPPRTYRFVHLGGRRVCLVLTKFMNGWGNHVCHPDCDGNLEPEKMVIVLVTFEYAINKKETKSISVQFLGTRILEYDTNRVPRESSKTTKSKQREWPCNEDEVYSTRDAHMLGAFVLGGSRSGQEKKLVKMKHNAEEASSTTYQGGNCVSALSPHSTSSVPSSIAFSQPSIPVFRQNYPYFRSYGHYLPPCYMPPMHQFLGHNGLSPQASAGNVFLPRPALLPPGVKYSQASAGNVFLPQPPPSQPGVKYSQASAGNVFLPPPPGVEDSRLPFKEEINDGNRTQCTIQSDSSFINTPAGYAPGSPVTY